MSPAEQLIARQKARLLKIEQAGVSEIVRSYQSVLRDLNERLGRLSARIDQARSAGETVNEWWLYREARYQSLVRQLETRTLQFLEEAITTVETSKAAAATQAMSDAPALATEAAGRAPRAAKATIQNSFTRLPDRQINRIVLNAGNDMPLGRLIYRIAPQSSVAVKDALASGVARGAPVREIGADVRKASGIAQNRAAVIARQEVIRSYRETSAEMYKRSEVVKGFVWHAELDSRTCPVCWSMHGTVITDADSIESHPLCRCAMLPKTKSWEELGFEGIPDTAPTVEPGPDVFARLPETDQLAILGRTRFDAYHRGDMALTDVVRRTRSAEWGPGRRIATLAELGI